jgi:hypothetical protein
MQVLYSTVYEIYMKYRREQGKASEYNDGVLLLYMHTDR